MKSELKDNKVIIYLEGRIDSNNAAQAEAEIGGILSEAGVKNVVFDAADLEYISSAGLRCMLHVRKNYPSLQIINVNSDVYEIFDMTGFTEMIDVKKAYKVVSVEGCDIIGRGANGSIYRIDQDNVVKVYKNADALAEIQHEREVARLALILGIPTAISYDVVRVGDSYGSVFELLNARSFARILRDNPEQLDWCVDEYVEMLRRIHSTEVPPGKLPDMKDTVVSWAEFMQDYLPEKYAKKLMDLVNEVPKNDHMIHGDYHTKNLELQNDEVLLIDMDTLAVGDPIFELASMFNAYIGFFELDHDAIEDFQGFPYDIAEEFWHKTLAEYLGTDNEEIIREVEDKARIIGYTRLIRRSIRRNGLNDPEKKAEIDHWTKELTELLDKYDTLLFDAHIEDTSMEAELDIEATEENLPKVMEFVDARLEAYDCPMKAQMQIDVAVEEIYINIAKYAYKPDTGRAKVRVEIDEDPKRVAVTFIDQGRFYDPLAKEDPDITLSAEERPIGGLGIFMVKKTMDDVAYEYRDGSNILTLTKNF